ncbi:hypothetical protein M409DRAFT_69238 [Zasmidium cellare ATCC 36951]|uniref:Sterol regulatory element-binding protein cleavage-activating protein n=1 Tax=Zasmidium cellare ATCC 36951 TaxID=1080233 RepID=A0A6A6C635_ZASCE|nr:uncharacterized protein M409DRAFT_69238 [Zasmidium cellare ATCC 36951]KAF2162353.1 hypothetical protein M409DRAFT_69238 [Zasmidium cellare ATCC 36951]
MGFSYPTIFLSENPTAGFAAYPHTFWTSAKPIDNASTSVDVEMRQIWVHGSYMNALDKDVLKRALAVQQSLVGDEKLSNVIPALNDKLRSSSLQWGYHSPLMYWNNSQDTIDADTDVLRTINDQRNAHSSLNVVLRPASVFAGKKFERRRLLAADALVITLMNKATDGAGSKWQQNMRSLTDGACGDCTLFPHDGHITRQRVYEFSFTPLSFSEHLALTFAYSCMALYVLLSLRRMKAFHSRFGLVVTAITQMTCSILASFTICGILKINLSMVPQNAYPFVVLVLGVENMFRLINAVLAYPPTMATELRIANALGEVGPISVAAAAQNLTILALLSTVVSPGVAAFCAFAAIATLFDVFFLLTFFVAVLNVDINRLELQDALAARHNQPRHRKRQAPSHHTWFDALVQGRLPFSTRMAGTAVTTAFILSLNYHFFEHKEKATNLRHLLDMVRGGPPSLGDLETFAPPPMNASLTPGEWMRMQDFDTAKEVMRLAKPGADSFVVRVFAPLVIVLGGSDRTGVARSGEAWAHALRSFAIHHFYPVAVAIVFAVAFVAVLMNFLLYNEAGDEDNDMAFDQAEERLVVHTVSLPHKLDIVKMASSDSGHFVTVALDRTIAISMFDRATQTHHTVAMPTKVLNGISWPIHHIAIDDTGEWVACHCANDSILAYNCSTGSFIPTLVQYPDDHPAVLFAFLSLATATGSKPYFLVLTSGGRLAMSCLEDGKSIGADLSITPLLGATIADSAQGRQLLFVTEQVQVISHSWTGDSWSQINEHKLGLETAFGRLAGPVSLQLYSDLDTELVVVKTANMVVFLDSSSLAQVAALELAQTGSHLDAILIGASRKCPACSGLALRNIAATTSSSGKDDRVVTTWTVDNDEGCFCLTQSSSVCLAFDSTTKDTITINHPDAWSVVKSQAILGMRGRRQQQASEKTDSRRMTTTQLRQRRHARQNAQSQEDREEWEAYKISIDGDMETADIPSASDSRLAGQETDLYVNNAGPVVPLDPQAVAVAFGNSVRIIRSSRRGSINRISAGPSLERQSSTSRRVTSRRAR